MWPNSIKSATSKNGTHHQAYASLEEVSGFSEVGCSGLAGQSFWLASWGLWREGPASPSWKLQRGPPHALH